MDIETRLTARVQPNARKNEIQGFRDGVLYIKISAPPVEGKANKELIGFLSDVLGIAKSRISIEKGVTGRNKQIGISGLNQEQVTDIIAGLSKKPDLK